MERVLKTYVQLVYAFMYLPVTVVALFSFNSAEIMAFPMTGFALDWYDVAVHESPARRAHELPSDRDADRGYFDDPRRHGGNRPDAPSLPRPDRLRRPVIVPFFIPKMILAVADVIAMAVLAFRTASP